MLSWLSCKEFTMRASRKIDDVLHKPGVFGYLFHRLLCKRCRQFEGQIKVIDKSFDSIRKKHPSESNPIPPKLSENKKREITDKLKLIKKKEQE